MTQFSPLDPRYYAAANSLGIKSPEKMHPDMLMRTLGALTASPTVARKGAVASDYRSAGDQARAIASVARRNNIPFYAGLLRTGIPGMAAPVGRSKHQRGEAVDISENTVGPSAAQGLYANTANFGLKQPLPRSDRNHIELDKNAMGPFPAPGLEDYIEGKKMDKDWLLYNVANKVGEANDAVAGTRAKYVGANGRLDPSAVNLEDYGISPEVARDMGLFSGNAKLRAEMMGSAIRKPERGWGDYLGAALQAIAMPVMVGHDNNPTGAAALAKDNIMTRYADKMSDFEKLQQTADINSASSYLDRLDALTADRVKRTLDDREKARDEIRFLEATGRGGNITPELRKRAGYDVGGPNASATTGRREMAPDAVNGATDPGFIPAGAGAQTPSAPVSAGGSSPTESPEQPAQPKSQAEIMMGARSEEAAKYGFYEKRYGGPDGTSLKDIDAIRQYRGDDAAKLALKTIEADPEYQSDVARLKKYSEKSAEFQADIQGQIKLAQSNADVVGESLARIEALLTGDRFSERAIGQFDAGGFDWFGTGIGPATSLGDTHKNAQFTQNNLRSEIKYLAATMKDYVRKPGDGVWTDYDQKNLEEMASGNILRASDQADALAGLRLLKDRIEGTYMRKFGVKIPSVKAGDVDLYSQRGVKNSGAPSQRVDQGKADTGGLSLDRAAWKDSFTKAKIGDVFTLPNGKSFLRVSETEVEPIDSSMGKAEELPRFTRESQLRRNRMMPR